MAIGALRYFLLNKFNKTQFTNQYSLIFLCFGYGILLDYARVIFISLGGAIIWEFDLVLFITKYFLIMLGVFFVIRIFILVSDYVERDFKHANALQAYSLIIAVIFSVLNVFSYYTTDSNPNGYFIFQSNIIMFCLMLSFFLPMGIFLVHRNRIILKNVKNDKIRRDILFIIFIIAVLIIERGYHFAIIGIFYYYLHGPISVALIIDSGLLIFILTTFTIFEIKYPRSMQRISMHFSVKAVYLIKKTGQLLFEYNFEEDQAKKPDSLVVGGFIYAITSGIKNMLKLKKDITSFTSKKRSVLVQHGEHLFGVLIVRENAQILHDNLIKLIKKYEKRFIKELEDWSGRVPSPKSQEVINWIHELFRKE